MTPSGAAQATVVNAAPYDGRVAFVSRGHTMKVKNAVKQGRATVTILRPKDNRYVTVEGPAMVHGWDNTSSPYLLLLLRKVYTATGRPPERPTCRFTMSPGSVTPAGRWPRHPTPCNDERLRWPTRTTPAAPVLPARRAGSRQRRRRDHDGRSRGNPGNVRPRPRRRSGTDKPPEPSGAGSQSPLRRNQGSKLHAA